MTPTRIQWAPSRGRIYATLTIRAEANTVYKAKVQFTEFAAQGECPQDLQFQDNLVVTVLGDGFRISIEGNTLTLTIAGDEGLIYRADS